MFKVIIAGGRKFEDYKLLKLFCDRALSLKTDIEIVSGCAKGADSLGEKYARLKGYKIKKFPADWDKHKLSAGPIRNQEMANYADALIVFWDGQSRGSQDMISKAKSKGLGLKICKY